MQGSENKQNIIFEESCNSEPSDIYIYNSVQRTIFIFDMWHYITSVVFAGFKICLITFVKIYAYPEHKEIYLHILSSTKEVISKTLLHNSIT